MRYLISGLKEEDFKDNTVDDNQLRYEKYLRSIITEKQDKKPDGDVKRGENSSRGLPWKYY